MDFMAFIVLMPLNGNLYYILTVWVHALYVYEYQSCVGKVIVAWSTKKRSQPYIYIMYQKSNAI